MIDGLLTSIFAIWILLSILVYVPKIGTWIRGSDFFSLIPEWKFFAPAPGRWDYYLLYRDQLADESVTDWTETEVAGTRQWWNFIWNPSRRGRKALFDATSEMGRRLVAGEEGLEASVAYLTVLNYVSSLPRSSASRFTQFLLLRMHAPFSGQAPDLIFSSTLHSL